MIKSFDEEQIEAWAEDHFRRSGRWPTPASGEVLAAPGEQWVHVSRSLNQGGSGRAGGSTFPQFLVRYIAKRGQALALPYDAAQIASWMRAFAERFGKYPSADDGSAACPAWETWGLIDAALREGRRGLPGGSSLMLFRIQLINDCVLPPLNQLRGDFTIHIKDKEIASWAKDNIRRRKTRKPLLNEDLILTWADEHFQAYGKWPHANSGPILGHEPNTWCAISLALQKGLRGLQPHSSLSRLLEERRGVPNYANKPRFTVEKILRWVDEHYATHDAFPTVNSGLIDSSPEDTWYSVDKALRNGNRGLPGGSGLAPLLQEQRGKRNQMSLPKVTEEDILAWADEHHQRTKRWPTRNSGVIQAAPTERWLAINGALINGLRGLPGGLSLARLLEQYRGVRPWCTDPVYDIDEIAAWMRGHAERHGRYPSCRSGVIADHPDITWGAVQIALLKGYRGLPGGSSLAKLKQQLMVERKLPALDRSKSAN